jgi:hypothetical protein
MFCNINLQYIGILRFYKTVLQRNVYVFSISLFYTMSAV